MPDNISQPKGVYKYKGDTGIFIKLQSLASTHGDKTIGELEEYLDSQKFQEDFEKAKAEKGE